MIHILKADGNTGVARGAFIAAMKLKKRIMTHVASGKMTDDGLLPDQFKYGLNSFDESKTDPAWLENVRGSSNVTLVLYASPDDVDRFSIVEDACRQYGKQFVKYRIDIDGDFEKQAAEIHEALFATDVADMWLNVIGSRETERPGIQKAVDAILTIVFTADLKTYSWDPFHFKMMTGNLKDYIVVPEERRYVIPYEYRKVTESFFKEFCCYEWFAKPKWGTNVRPHRGGNFRNTLHADDGFSIEIEATVDSNERLVKFEAKAAKRTIHTGEYDGLSDHWKRSCEWRGLTEKDFVMLRELLDLCTRPRAPELAQLLCGTPRTLSDGTEVYISDDCVVYKSKWMTCPTAIPLRQFYEFLEWSYSYLECFTLEKFVEANLPWSRIGLKSRYMMLILRLSDPRRIYSYAYVLDAYHNRISWIHDLYYQYQGTQHDWDFLEKNKQAINENLRRCFGSEYVPID